MTRVWSDRSLGEPHSGQVWSLWGMLKQNAALFMQLGELINDSESVFQFVEADKETGGTDARLRDHEVDNLKSLIVGLKKICADLAMPVSTDLLNRRTPETAGEMSMLSDAIKSELRSRLFLFVPQERAGFYESPNVVSESVKRAFPLASQEMRHAANCHAFGEPTASVFHAMRALEKGLNVLARDCEIEPSDENWQNILDQIEKALKKVRDSKKSDEKSRRVQFLSEAASEFRHFKDAWRNHVSHGKISYDPAQSERVIQHVASFLDALTSQLSE